MKRALTTFVALLAVAMTLGVVSARAGDPSAERERERHRVLERHFGAAAVVGRAARKLADHKELDAVEKLELDRAVRELEKTEQAYRRTIW